MLFLQFLFFGGKHRDEGSSAQNADKLDLTVHGLLDGYTTAEGETTRPRFTADELRQAMTKTVRLIAKWTRKKCNPAERERHGYSLLNYAVSDGVSAVVTRYVITAIRPDRPPFPSHPPQIHG